MRDLRFAVDELGTELDRDVETRYAARPAAPADPIARLEHEHRAPGARQLIGRGETGRACPDDREFGVRRFQQLLNLHPGLRDDVLPERDFLLDLLAEALCVAAR